MQRVWIALGLLAAFGAGTAADRLTKPVQASTQVRAERVILVDRDGKKRADLGLDRSGQPNLELYDERGRVIWSARGTAIFPLRE